VTPDIDPDEVGAFISLTGVKQLNLYNAFAAQNDDATGWWSAVGLVVDANTGLPLRGSHRDR